MNDATNRAELHKMYNAAMNAYDASLIEHENAWRRAAMENDQDEMVRTSMEMAALSAQKGAYHDMAMQHSRSMQVPQQSNRFGLSETEREVAEASFPDRPDLPRMTADQKHAAYAANRDRYQQMRASGQYSDIRNELARR